MFASLATLFTADAFSMYPEQEVLLTIITTLANIGTLVIMGLLAIIFGCKSLAAYVKVIPYTFRNGQLSDITASTTYSSGTNISGVYNERLLSNGSMSSPLSYQSYRKLSKLKPYAVNQQGTYVRRSRDILTSPNTPGQYLPPDLPCRTLSASTTGSIPIDQSDIDPFYINHSGSLSSSGSSTFLHQMSLKFPPTPKKFKNKRLPTISSNKQSLANSPDNNINNNGALSVFNTESPSSDNDLSSTTGKKSDLVSSSDSGELSISISPTREALAHHTIKHSRIMTRPEMAKLPPLNVTTAKSDGAGANSNNINNKDV